MYRKYSDKNIEPLSELVSFRLTRSEYENWNAIAKNNYISISELIRNLMRENLHKFAPDKTMRKKLYISGKIEAFFVKDMVVSSRNDKNLIKMREILSNFEAFLNEHQKNFDVDELNDMIFGVDALVKSISEEDTFLFSKIESQYKRILKNKYVKGLLLHIVKD